MLLYRDNVITDVLKLPISEESYVSNVADGIEYIHYYESATEFTDDSHFVIAELTSVKGWNDDGECVFNTALSNKTLYSISAFGRIYKEDVVKSQSCSGWQSPIYCWL